MSRAPRRLFLLPLLAACACWPLTGALAQTCNPLQSFASVGNGGQGQTQLEIDASATEDAGNEIGRFWASSSSQSASSFQAGGSCPSGGADGWWTTRASGRRGIRGWFGYDDCQVSTCPAVGSDEMIFVVEDQGSGSGTAYFVGLRVNGFFGDIRTWNLARVVSSSTAVPMLEFPRPDPISSSGPPNEITLTLRYPDVAAGVHAVTDGDVPLPASSVIASYDLYRFIGPPHSSDPGRLASDWTLVDQTPYSDAEATVETVVSCLPSGAETYLALGLSFEGGAGPDVRSELVGQALHIECWTPALPVPAGAVANGGIVPGEPLRIAKSASPSDGTLTLTWDWSCQAEDNNFAVYEGQFGDFAGHAPVTCSTAGETSYELLPLAGDTYYLVVPISRYGGGYFVPAEGSYGLTSEGEERAQNHLAACMEQHLADCF